MAKEPRYHLKYFNFRILGEPIRWQFALAGVPFNDERLPRDTWDTEGIKQKVGWGKLPVLQIDGDLEITQSCAISRYLAKEFGLLPESHLHQARADELVDNLQDIRAVYRPFVIEKDPAKKESLGKQMVEVHFSFYLPKLEEFVKKHGSNGFAVGQMLSWADLYLANFLQIWTDNHGKEILAKYPLLEAHLNKITSIPQIDEFNRKRPVTRF